MGLGTSHPLAAEMPVSLRLLSSSSLRPFFLLSISLLTYFLLDLWHPRFLPDVSGEFLHSTCPGLHVPVLHPTA